MKIAIIGSRNLTAENLGGYLPPECTEIVSGGAKGIDSCAADYARANGLTLTEFLPDYKKYGRGAPLVRNKQIVDYADLVIAFWNGESKGTRFTVNYAQKQGKPVKIVIK
ncbi:MAG: DUF2493 domain-containing protein [Ruminococcaceae bacterium]|nr:DUF2493 domain-containing protein [Oscillospiraceae bacterium]